MLEQSAGARNGSLRRGVAASALACAFVVAPAAGAQALSGSEPAPTPGVTAPVGPGHRGGAELDRTGVILHDRPAGVPAPPALAAGAYLVANLDTGDVILAFNPHVQALPASTMKTLTALALVPELDPAQVVQATPADAAIDGTKVGIDPGASYTVDQLFHALMMASANDAAAALARAAGGMEHTLARMNRIARDIGAVDTVAKNPTGLDAVGQVTTAYDLALIGRAAVADERVSRYATTKTLDFPSGRTERGRSREKYQIANHNRLVWNYEGTLGVKNGYTVKAQQTFVGAARRGDQSYIVTYLAGAGGGWRPTADLLDWAFTYGSKLRPVGTLEQPAAQQAPGATDDPAVALNVSAGAVANAGPKAGGALSDPLVRGAGALVALAAAVVGLRIRAVRSGSRPAGTATPRPASASRTRE